LVCHNLIVFKSETFPKRKPTGLVLTLSCFTLTDRGQAPVGLVQSHKTSRGDHTKIKSGAGLKVKVTVTYVTIIVKILLNILEFGNHPLPLQH